VNGWTYEDGITRLAKHLFDRAGVTIERDTRIVDVRREGGWRLTDAGGHEHGPFDTLLLNPPAPQTAELLRATGSDVVERLGDAAAEVGYKTVWTAILGYGFELGAPYYGLARADADCNIRWIGREKCKPGHVPDGASVLVVQAGPEWSAERYDDAPRQNITDLARCAAEIMDDRRVADPDWTDHQGWKYAFPEANVPGAVLRETARDSVYVTGDWGAGEARLHAAVRNGLATGDTVVASLREKG
jgi:predicted NAD/FAD-dependent oxidoreductase